MAPIMLKRFGTEKLWLCRTSESCTRFEPRQSAKSETDIDTRFHAFHAWYPAAFCDEDGEKWSCVEQYVQARKARLCGDAFWETQVMLASDPNHMYKCGFRVRNFAKVNWEDYDLDILVHATALKFSQHPRFLTTLMETNDRDIVSEGDANLLGHALVQIREFFSQS